MKIEYLGHSCFRITSSNGFSLLTDPYTRIGYELSEKYKADVALISHNHYDHNYIAGVEVCRTLTRSVRYEENGVKIEGVNSFHDEKQGALRGNNIIFKIEIDGITVCHLGDVGEPYTKELGDQIGKVDVLLIPVGGNYTIDAQEAKKYVEKLSPKIAIPMHYKPKEGGIDIDSAENFLAQFSKVTYPTVKHKTEIEKDVLRRSGTEIIYMERKK